MSKILIIDDNKNNLLTISATLGNYLPDYKVITATDAGNGIDLAKEENPDVILLDIIMPDIDGFEACRILKSNKQTSNIPIILLTALLTNTESKIKGLDSGADAFLPKPFDPAELIAQVKAMIRIKKAEAKLIRNAVKLEQKIIDQAKVIVETNKDYKALFDNIGEGIGKLDENNNFVYLNKKGAELFESGIEELLNTSITLLFSDDEQEALHDGLLKARDSKASQFQLVYKTQNGNTKDLFVTTMSEFDSGGNYIGLSCIFRDVSNIVEHERMLKMQLGLAKALGQADTLTGVAGIILDFTLSTKEIDGGSLYIKNSSGDFVLLGAKGKAEAFVKHHKKIARDSVQSRVANEGKPIYRKYADIPDELKLKGVPATPTFVGLIPVLISGETIAILNVGTSDYEEFSSETIKLVEYFHLQLGQKLQQILFKNEKIENEVKYRVLFEGNKDALLTIKGRMINSCNNALVSMLKYKSKDDIIGKSPISFSPNRKIGRFIPAVEGSKAIKETLQNGSASFEWVLQKSDGEIFWVEARLSLVVINNERLIYATLRDLTNEKSNLEEIKKFKLTTDQANYGCAMADMEGKIIYSNEYFAKMHGYSPSEIMGQSFHVLYSKEQLDIVKRLQKKILLNGHYTNEEVYHITKDGKELPILMNGVLMYDEFGKPKYITSTAIDISEIKAYHKNLETALARAEESDRLKNAFLASISHEFRTPLNAIIGFSQLISNEENIEQVKVYSNLIMDSGMSLLEIVKDIFYFTLIRSGQEKVVKEKTDLKSLLDEVYTTGSEIQQASNKTGIKFKLDCPPNTPQFLNTDKSKLVYVLKLLIKNAFKFTIDGFVEIGCTLTNDNGIKFYVKDTGIGIPDDQKDIIFKFFRQMEDSFTRRFGGVGIGLSIARRLVEMLGGTISVDSEVDKGSVFYFTVPI